MTPRRFQNLDERKREAILRVAAEEFAAHGFAAASYNRIIQRAGLSKGSMYYYFCDKADLYAVVQKTCMARWIEHAGDMRPIDSAESFWREFETLYLRSLTFLRREPSAVGLLKGLFQTMGHGESASVLVELRQIVRARAAQLLSLGQKVGAVRTDLPAELLLNVLTCASEGIDSWLSVHADRFSDKDLARVSAPLVDVFRRIAEPRPGGAVRKVTWAPKPMSRRRR